MKIFKKEPTYEHFKYLKKLWCSENKKDVDTVTTALHQLSGGIFLPAIHLMVGNHCLSHLEQVAFKFANHEHSDAFRNKPTLRSYFGVIPPTSLANKQVT